RSEAQAVCGAARQHPTLTAVRARGTGLALARLGDAAERTRRERPEGIAVGLAGAARRRLRRRRALTAIRHAEIAAAALRAAQIGTRTSLPDRGEGGAAGIALLELGAVAVEGVDATSGVLAVGLPDQRIILAELRGRA